jgi:hypothetical protein
MDGGRGFRTKKNVFRIGGNTFYDRKNKIPMKFLEFKRFGIGLVVKFRGIPNGFPNQGSKYYFLLPISNCKVFFCTSAMFKILLLASNLMFKILLPTAYCKL